MSGNNKQNFADHIHHVVSSSGAPDSSLIYRNQDNLQFDEIKYRVEYHANIMFILGALLIIHWVSILPQNSFFYLLYFPELFRSETSFRFYEISTLFNLLNSVLNSVLYFVFQRKLNLLSKQYIWCGEHLCGRPSEINQDKNRNLAVTLI